MNELIAAFMHGFPLALMWLALVMGVGGVLMLVARFTGDKGMILLFGTLAFICGSIFLGLPR